MHTARGSSWKLWLVIIALILVIAVLGFLCVRFFLMGDSPFRLGSPAPVVDSSLSTTIGAQDAKGKDVTSNISVTGGTLRPDTVEPDAELTLLDIGWAGKKDASFPMILTVSDNAFPNNDGLSVYHYADGVWELLGTYLIENHSVSFQTDSLSPFAFQVISSKPVVTPTPEPTDTPIPTETPEPTPEPIDYGLYDQIQVGEFIQVDSLAKDGAYVIALVNDPNAKSVSANNGDNDEAQDGDAVTFFDAVQGGETLDAVVLMNYDGTKLATLDIKVTKGSNGRYAIVDPVSAGMLWTAGEPEYYGDASRFSLKNNNKYLNLDEQNEHVVMDDNETRTRWLAQTVTPENGASLPSLTYRVEPDSYYIKGFEKTATTDSEGTSTDTVLSVPVSRDKADAQRIVLFQLRTAIPTATPKSDNTNNSGMLIITNTPDAVEGIDATPEPTATPPEDDTLVPVTDPPTPTAPPTQAPEEDLPTPPPQEEDPASGSDATDPGDNEGDTEPDPVDDDSPTDA